MHITERDLAMLALVAEHRFVLAAQIALALEVSTTAAARRLGALRRAGLLAGERRLRGEPTAYSVTLAGLRAIGSPLPKPRDLDLGVYRHDLGVAWLAVAARRGVYGPLTDIVSERRMRSEDGRCARDPASAGDEAHGVRVGWDGDGRRRLHYPDLVVVTDGGHRVAFELELTGKSRARRERILSAYAGDRRFDAVVYLVDKPATGRAIERSARRVGAAGTVRVQTFSWTRDRRPPPRARSIERAAPAREAER